MNIHTLKAGMDVSILSEDCLYLDVYAPSKDKKGGGYPIMVWIHGGAFVLGTKNEYSGANFAQVISSI